MPSWHRHCQIPCLAPKDSYVLERTPSQLGEGVGHFSTRSLQLPVTLELFQSNRLRVADTASLLPLTLLHAAVVWGTLSGITCRVLENWFSSLSPAPCFFETSILFTISACVCCVWGHMYVDVRGQLLAVCSVLSCGILGLSSGCQTWAAGAESTCWPLFFFFLRHGLAYSVLVWNSVVGQAGLKLGLILPWKCWDCRCVPPCLACSALEGLRKGHD